MEVMHHKVFCIVFNHQGFLSKKTYLRSGSVFFSFNALLKTGRNCDGKKCFPLCHFACYITYFSWYVNQCLAFQLLLSKRNANSLPIVLVARHA